MKDWGQLPQWQRQRAEKLDAICTEIEAAGPGNKLKAIAKAVSTYNGAMLQNGSKSPKPLRLSEPTLRRAFEMWFNNGKTPQGFHLAYTKCGKLVPRDLIVEWQKRLTTPGIDHDGKKSAYNIYKKLRHEWAAGYSIPGLGTWREYWTANHPKLPAPHSPPDFPFAYHTLLRYRPDVLTAALGNQGVATARDALSKITRDSSELRPCELFVLDDVKADVVVLDDWSGSLKLVEPTLYFMMEVGCRFIAGFVTRGTDAILQADVDALIAHVLGTMGLGNGYATHILFERGTVACSEARQRFLEGMFPDQIFVHRTSMNSGRAYPGAYADKSSGRPNSKGMIEAFMRKLHLRLAALPGQTGSNQRVNQPAELEARLQETETLAFLEEQTGAKMEMPILRLSQFAALVRMAVNDYNTDCQHDCQGFHKKLQMEVQPGVWRDVPEHDSASIIPAVQPEASRS